MSITVCNALPLGRFLAILAKSYFGALTKRLEHHEIERYYSVLILIDKTEHPCTQQFICSQLKIDKVSMVRILDYLSQKDFIEKQLNPADRREHFIVLKKKAVKILPELYVAIEELNSAAMKGIPADEQKVLLAQIATMHSNLEALPNEKIYINYQKANRKK
ncbi:MAG: MarR family transcriptional regulator [Chitinophagaceae bacterium]|nr:MarR family transcriptional regulator [Chitinophagaceae bacterium]